MEFPPTFAMYGIDAQLTGTEVVRIQRRVVRQGPLFWTTSRSQSVYHVVARDASGRERAVWARWGRSWLFAPDLIELRWER